MNTPTTPTGTQVAFGLTEVPARKYRRMVARTIVGAVAVGLLTIFLLGFAWLYFQRTGELSLWLVGGGVACGFICGQIASGQIVGGAMLSLVRPMRKMRAAWKGDDDA